ncbi:MAG: hypothetical protein Q8K75_13065 [Chlamydiales bacterium]|nr:hypothetical protein [Chlamydiales bacterium]
MKWQVLKTAPTSAVANMAFDTALLRLLKQQSEPVLHNYEWSQNALTFGYFVDPTKYLRPLGLSTHRYQIARRPTGGGIIFHTYDLAFSVLLPSGHPHFSQNTLETYALINGAVLQAIRRFKGIEAPTTLLANEPQLLNAPSKQFCMAHPTKYDVMWQGQKVGGSAQRRTKNGLLHQGSICLGMVPEDVLSTVLLGGGDVINDMKANSYPLLGLNPTPAELEDARCQLRALLAECLQNIEEVRP